MNQERFDELVRALATNSLSRRQMLKSLAAGVLLAGPLGALWPSEAEARRRRRRRPTPPPYSGEIPTILGGEVYPIGLWWPPPPTQTTVQRYQEIAAAGFNFVIGGNGVTNDTYNPAALEAARANNLWYVLRDSKLTRIIRDSADYSDPQAEVRTTIDQLLQRYGGYQALTGLYLYDEPHRARFEILGYAREVLQGLDGKKLPYVNVWPYTKDSTQLGTSTYEEYLRLYLSEVKPPFLSFDHYPLLSDTQVTANYFDNWAMIRRFSLLVGIPSWVFIQSVDFKWTQNTDAPRRRPNEAELFWQVNVSLAYGAKGIQYFTYWTPHSNEEIQFGEALASVDGELTPLYDYAKRVNNYLKVVGKTLLPLTSESVVHAGEDPLPRGATAFSADGYVQSTSRSPVILSRFRQSAEGTERYLLVVNRSFIDEAQTQLTLSNSVSEVFELDSETETFAQVEQQGTLQLTVAPGGARLYRLHSLQTN